MKAMMRCLSNIIRASNGFVGALKKEALFIVVLRCKKDAGTGFIRSPHLNMSLADTNRYGIFVLHSLCGAWVDLFCGKAISLSVRQPVLWPVGAPH